MVKIGFGFNQRIAYYYSYRYHDPYYYSFYTSPLLLKLMIGTIMFILPIDLPNRTIAIFKH